MTWIPESSVVNSLWIPVKRNSFDGELHMNYSWIPLNSPGFLASREGDLHNVANHREPTYGLLTYIILPERVHGADHWKSCIWLSIVRGAGGKIMFRPTSAPIVRAGLGYWVREPKRCSDRVDNETWRRVVNSPVPWRDSKIPMETRWILLSRG